jgi:glycosyltransferase involved in cell wall biosynthesis/O-antigen/teichoic acid export membrane protein
MRSAYALLVGGRFLTHNLIVGAGTIAAGILGVVFQALVSHHLRPSDYGDVFTVVTLITFISLPASAFTLLMARETSRDRAYGQQAPSATLLRRCNRALILAGLVIAAILAVASPLLADFLGVRPLLLVAAAAGVPFGLTLPLLMGDLQGDQRFIAFAILSVGQAGLKVLAAVALGTFFGSLGIIAGISLATVVIYLVVRQMLRPKLSLKLNLNLPWWPPAAAYLAVVLPSTIALAVVLSSDVVLVKHYFPTRAAGEYAAVAALGRAVFWGASGIAVVLFPKVVYGRARGSTGRSFVSASLLLVAVGGLFGLGLLTFGSTQLLTAFAGPAYVAGANYLPWYAVGMTMLGGVAVLTAAQQSRGKPAFLAVLVPLSVLEPALLLVFHSSLAQVVLVVDLATALLLLGLAVLYLIQERLERSMADVSAPVDTMVGALFNSPLDEQSVAVSADPITEQEDKRLLRILILNYRCPDNPRAGGAERFTYEVAKRLVSQGHAVEWFSSSFRGSQGADDLDGIRMVRLGSQWSVYWHAYLRYRKSARDRFDVVVDEVNGVPFFAAFWSGLPTIMLIHQLYRELWLRNAPPPLSVIGFLAEPIYLRWYRRIPVLTVSTSTRDDLRRLGFKGPITVVPEGLETVIDRSKSKPIDPSFLYVGRLVPSKQVEHMLMALARFRYVTGAGALTLVGSGHHQYRDSLMALALRLGIQEHVTFLGWVSSSNKHQLMADAHALLMTSVREGWGLVVTEANACGTPAIVYDVPGLRDSVRHEVTGLVVPPRPYSLAEAMIRVTTDQDLYARLAAGSQRWSTTFSFDETARVVGHELEKALAV